MRNLYEPQEFFEPVDAGSSWGYPIYEPRPNTFGNKVGDYIARLIDTPINAVKGLLKRIK